MKIEGIPKPYEHILTSFNLFMSERLNKQNWSEFDHLFQNKKLFEVFFKEIIWMWDWTAKRIIARVIWLFEKRNNLSESMQKVYSTDLLQTSKKTLKVFSMKRT